MLSIFNAFRNPIKFTQIVVSERMLAKTRVSMEYSNFIPSCPSKPGVSIWKKGNTDVIKRLSKSFCGPLKVSI